MAQLTEAQLTTKIAAIDAQLDELVASGVVGFNAGAGGPSVTGDAIRSLKELREMYVKQRNGTARVSFSTQEYDVDEFGNDQTEYQDG